MMLVAHLKAFIHEPGVLIPAIRRPSVALVGQYTTRLLAQSAINKPPSVSTIISRGSARPASDLELAPVGKPATVTASLFQVALAEQSGSNKTTY